MTIERQFSAFFSSAVGRGSVKNSLGNRFSVELSTPLSIPQKTVYASLEVVRAKVWNSSPNISADIGNNHVHFSYNGVTYNAVLPDGLYGRDEMNVFMTIYFSNDAELPNDLFSFEENGATQKLSITFKYVGISIDFTPPNACTDVTGFYTTHDEGEDIFTSTLIVTSTIAGETVTAPEEARFNRVVNYYITSNLISDGNRSSGVISEVPITVKPGSLINYLPTNPLRSDCSDLIGQTKQNITFALVDQLGRNVSTSGEDWSLAIVIRYHF
jgi:hypothetical protein